MSTKRPSNVAILTRENKIWAAKKRQKKEQVKEVLFDENARREFLTGFHKRKVARQEAGKAKAAEKERLMKRDERRERRQELAQRARENALAVEKAYAGDSDNDDTVAASSSHKGPFADEIEFEDEEQLATVTVVEDFEAEDLKTMSISRPMRTEGERADRPPTGHNKPIASGGRPRFPPKPVASKPKFRYETKAARKHEKVKQRARRTEKANLGSRRKGRH